jgi:LysR family transcriptional regulator, low CO2-responsive transcriptional regulator
MHQLQVFAAVVEHGSLTQAAEHLFLTQPAVSIQVRRLQEQVGAPILVRVGRRVVPTEAGLTLYRYACDMLASADALQRDIKAMSTGELDHLTVAANSAYSAYVLPEILARFQRTHPRMQLTLAQASTLEIVEQVRRGQIDIGIAHPLRERGKFDGIHLGSDELIIVESTADPISTDQTLTLDALSRTPFVRTPTGRNHLTTMRLDHLLLAAGHPPARLAMVMSSWEGVLEAVRRGVGLAIAWHAVVWRELEHGVLRQVNVEGYHDVHNVYLLGSPPRTQGRPTTAFQELESFLRSEISALLRRRPNPAALQIHQN